MIDEDVLPNNRWSSRVKSIGLILLLNTAGIFYYLYYLSENGYLPSPFIFDKSNTFMDLFNVLHWSYDDGRYTDWGSVYPPLSFILLRFANFLFAGAGFGDPELMRDASTSVIVALFIVYLAVPAAMLKLKNWLDFSDTEKVLIYFTIILSAPMLFALERGNLILIAPLLLALAVSKIGIVRSVSIALMINIKPYFALLMFYYLARRNWKGFVSCILMSGLIFLISGLILDKHFLIFFTNLFNFSQEANLFSLREVLALPSSISAFSYVLSHPDGAMFASDILTTQRSATLAFLIEIIKWVAIVASFAVLSSKARLMSDQEILTLLVVIVSNLGIWVGGYTLILYAALIPVFFKMRARLVYICLLYLIAAPLDIIPLLGDFVGIQYSYLAAEYIEIRWTLGLGSVVRPVANLTLLLLLTHEIFERKSARNVRGKQSRLIHSLGY